MSERDVRTLAKELKDLALRGLHNIDVPEPLATPILDALVGRLEPDHAAIDRRLATHRVISRAVDRIDPILTTSSSQGRIAVRRCLAITYNLEGNNLAHEGHQYSHFVDVLFEEHNAFASPRTRSRIVASARRHLAESLLEMYAEQGEHPRPEAVDQSGRRIPRRADLYVSRDELEREFASALRTTSRVVLVGEPGTGKTTVLRHYLGELKPSAYLDLNGTTLRSAIAFELERRGFNMGQPHDDAEALVQLALAMRSDRLKARLIAIDSIKEWTPEIVRALADVPCAVVVTSRSRSSLWAANWVAVAVPSMNADESRALVDSLLPDASESEVAQLDRLSGRPLAITHAAAFARDLDTNARNDFFDLLANDRQLGLSIAAGAAETESLRRIYERLIDTLEARVETAHAVEVLTYMLLWPPGDRPIHQEAGKRLVRNCMIAKYPSGGLSYYEASCRMLARYLIVDEDENGFGIHDLTRDLMLGALCNRIPEQAKELIATVGEEHLRDCALPFGTNAEMGHYDYGAVVHWISSIGAHFTEEEWFRRKHTQSAAFLDGVVERHKESLIPKMIVMNYRSGREQSDDN